MIAGLTIETLLTAVFAVAALARPAPAV